MDIQGLAPEISTALPGNLLGLENERDRLEVLADAHEDVALALRNLRTDDWTGPAADRFEEVRQSRTRSWLIAADTHQEASRALTAYLETLRRLRALANAALADARQTPTPANLHQTQESLTRWHHQLTEAAHQTAQTLRTATQTLTTAQPPPLPSTTPTTPPTSPPRPAIASSQTNLPSSSTTPPATTTPSLAAPPTAPSVRTPSTTPSLAPPSTASSLATPTAPHVTPSVNMPATAAPSAAPSPAAPSLAAPTVSSPPTDTAAPVRPLAIAPSHLQTIPTSTVPPEQSISDAGVPPLTSAAAPPAVTSADSPAVTPAIASLTASATVRLTVAPPASPVIPPLVTHGGRPVEAPRTPSPHLATGPDVAAAVTIRLSPLPRPHPVAKPPVTPADLVPPGMPPDKSADAPSSGVPARPNHPSPIPPSAALSVAAATNAAPPADRNVDPPPIANRPKEAELAALCDAVLGYYMSLDR